MFRTGIALYCIIVSFEQRIQTGLGHVCQLVVASDKIVRCQDLSAFVAQRNLSSQQLKPHAWHGSSVSRQYDLHEDHELEKAIRLLSPESLESRV